MTYLPDALYTLDIPCNLWATQALLLRQVYFKARIPPNQWISNDSVNLRGKKVDNGFWASAILKVPVCDVYIRVFSMPSFH